MSTVAPEVRPDVAAYLAGMRANPRPPFTAEVLAMIRTLPPEVMASMDLPVGEMARVEDFAFEGPGGAVAVRLFDARASRGPSPLILFFHGGGFVVGSIATHAGMAAEISRRLDLPLLSVEYRLAPEHPWPAAPDDAEAAARWVATEGAAALGLEVTGLVLCGDSAGGTLAAVTALALRDRPAAVPVAMQLLLYPGADRSRAYPSAAAFGDGYALDASNMALFNAHYAADHASWRCSPLLAELAGMPPALVATAGLDPLRDEGRAYAAKLVLAGVPTLYHEVAGTIHGFASYRAVIPSAVEDLAQLLTLAGAMLPGVRHDSV